MNVSAAERSDTAPVGTTPPNALRRTQTWNFHSAYLLVFAVYSLLRIVSRAVLAALVASYVINLTISQALSSHPGSVKLLVRFRAAESEEGFGRDAAATGGGSFICELTSCGATAARWSALTYAVKSTMERAERKSVRKSIHSTARATGLFSFHSWRALPDFRLMSVVSQRANWRACRCARRRQSLSVCAHWLCSNTRCAARFRPLYDTAVWQHRTALGADWVNL